MGQIRYGYCWNTGKPTADQRIANFQIMPSEVYTSETASSVKVTSVHVENMSVKQICNHKIWHYAMGFWVRELCGVL